jgi:hypothetical protein
MSTLQSGVFIQAVLPSNPIADSVLTSQSAEGEYPFATNRPSDNVDTRAHFAGNIEGCQRFSIRTASINQVETLEIWMGDYTAGTAVKAFSLDSAGNLTISGKLTCAS